ncbi:hypothetical protein [Nocardia blacklockiae]|uniref:hypothetical protein n=1 Tax=Nocardia blacklockiae TaxID=480036 RepID=UPI0018953492|nr:hypothetical protein [Nocardia blacklockiae]MBF6175793.1 hypothetical protein [Nocardia blacklockiae]
MDQLEDWLEGMQPRLAGLVDFELPPDALPDYSAASLARLEAELVARGAPGADFAERAAGYLGEALLSVAGGEWGWDDRRGLPVVLPDPALDLPGGVCPAELVERACRHRDGDEFGRSYRDFAQAVARQQAAVPGWMPTKQPTPGLDRSLTVAGADYLDKWLPERAADLPAWLAEYADRPERWDFSVESLDELETATRRLVPGPDELSAYPRFADGASWYLGEVLRPAMRAHWCYHRGEPDGDNMFIGRPFLDQLIPNGDVVVPFLLLQIALDDHEPGLLRRMFAQFT